MKNQILHIFQKDVRHHWLEIAVSVAVIVAYAWNAVTRPMVEYAPGPHTFLSRVLPPLVPIAWAFLIVRVLQGECMVGDRQFWVTRPYDWKKLLAAKLLFVFLFVNAPLFGIQVFMLLKAGFPPSRYVIGLLWLQLMWTLILILPAATLASITASIGQATLVVLGALLYIIGGAALDSVMPNAGVAPDSILDSLQIAMLISAGVAVVFWQYSRRRTAQSRLLLLGLAATIPIFIFATPYQTLIDHAYRQAAAAQEPPARLAFDFTKPRSRGRGYPEKNKVHVRLPLLVSGVTSGSMVQVNGTRVSIQAPDGRQWSSGWHAAGPVLLADRPHSQEDLTIDQSFFEQVKSVPVKVHISFALTLFEGKEARRIVAEASQFSVPGNGRCWLASRWSNELLCSFPLRKPFLLLSGSAEETTCAAREDKELLPAGAIGYSWQWNQSSDPAEFGISPVQSTVLYLSDWGEAVSREYVCPGTPLTFTTLQETQRIRSELDIDGIRLAHYQLIGVEDGGFGISVP